jgi:hypothetical protein
MKRGSKIRLFLTLVWALAALADARLTVAANSGQVIVLDGLAPGKLFEGVGAISGEGDARNTALFDNLLVNRVNGGAVPPTVFVQDGSPIYRP